MTTLETDTEDPPDEQPARRTRSVRPAVFLTFAVALLSVVTGVANIGTQTVLGPLAPYIPGAIQQSAGFTGALTGFLMLASAFGMRRGLRKAWYSTMIMLPLTFLQGLLQSSPLSVPLIILSIVSMPTVYASRARFNRSINWTTSQLAAGTALFGVQLYGTAGAYALRDQFSGISTLTDAMYFTIVTASTVGYGDITPKTQFARLFAMSIVVFGTASFAVALGAILGPAIQARLQTALGKMTESELELLDDHVIVLGYGELTQTILEELSEKAKFVVITPNPSGVRALHDRDINLIEGDPTDEGVLSQAGLDRAQAVVAATNDDGNDALAVLTARQLNQDIRIVAAATDRENVAKLKRAGANTVISPATIGGHLLVASALGKHGMEDLADQIIGRADTEE